jgi:general secretion pathway protein E/type IV pilus assembly protein PilB
MVFSTLHTNDAPSAFTRLIDMGLEPFLVSSTVEGVMAQRLVRTICPECKVSYFPAPTEVPPDFPVPADMQVAGHDGSVVGDRAPLALWKGAGCRACHQTGYRGRLGIFELMLTGDSIRELCVQRANASAIRNQALKEGMVTLRQDGWRKVLKGITTIEEVARATKGDITQAPV